MFAQAHKNPMIRASIPADHLHDLGLFELGLLVALMDRHFGTDVDSKIELIPISCEQLDTLESAGRR